MSAKHVLAFKHIVFSGPSAQFTARSGSLDHLDWEQARCGEWELVAFVLPTACR